MYVEVSPCPSHGFFTVHTPFSERQEFRVQSLYSSLLYQQQTYITANRLALYTCYISRVPSEQRR